MRTVTSAFVVAGLLLFYGTICTAQQDQGPPTVVYQPAPVHQPTTYSSALLTLRNPQVLDELQLTDSQTNQLKSLVYTYYEERNKRKNDILNEFARQAAAQLPNPGNGPIPLDFSSPVIQSALHNVETELDRELRNKVDDVLLPRQRQRFRELQARTEFNWVLDDNARFSILVPSLSLTNEQMKMIKNSALDFRAELDKEITQLREKRHREFWESILNMEQIEMLNKTMGQPLDNHSKNK